MTFIDPITKPKKEFATLIEKISSEEPPGIDTQYTHAIIIEYLQQIDRRLENLEKEMLRRKKELI